MDFNIRPKWNPLVQRLQGVSCRQQGFAAISITFMVGPDGDPVWWTEPDVVKIEPRNGASNFLHTILDIARRGDGPYPAVYPDEVDTQD